MTEHGSRLLGSLEPLTAAADYSAKVNHGVKLNSTGGCTLIASPYDRACGLIVNGAESGSDAGVRPFILGGFYRVYCSAAIAAAGTLLQWDASNPGQLVTATTGPAVAESTESTSGAGVCGVQWVAGTVASLGTPAPVAVNTTATITTTDIVPGAIFTSTTAGAVVATTPTGTLLSAQLPFIQIGGGCDIHIINTGGTNAITLTAGTDVTVTGGAVTAAQYSGTFRLKKLTATTWHAYRTA